MRDRLIDYRDRFNHYKSGPGIALGRVSVYSGSHLGHGEAISRAGFLEGDIGDTVCDDYSWLSIGLQSGIN